MTEERKTTPNLRGKHGWGIVDAVIRLREHGTDRVYGLPDPPARCTIGTAAAISVVDATRSVSRRHAELIPSELPEDQSPAWTIIDLNSTNGMRRDGETLSSFELYPGVEVTLGDLRLICESANLVTLVELLRRFIGLAPERQHEVDTALKTLRDWVPEPAGLLLIGDGDLIPVATRLHRLAMGSNASIVQYDKRDPTASLHAATKGTLCAVMKQPMQIEELVKAVQNIPFAQRPHLIVCAPRALRKQKRKDVTTGLKFLERMSVISFPSLSTRSAEVEFIVNAFVRDVEDEFKSKLPEYSVADRERLRTIEYESIAEIEETARRFVTMRFLGVDAGAKRLGMERTGLGKWARRRKIPTST